MSKQHITSKREHVDRPEISEIFVDFLRGVDINDGVLRFEFVVKRYREPQDGQFDDSRTCTACRLALPIVGVFDLFDKLEELVKALEKQGIIHREGAAPPSDVPMRKN
jgi:hypothetical protein